MPATRKYKRGVRGLVKIVIFYESAPFIGAEFIDLTVKNLIKEGRQKKIMTPTMAPARGRGVKALAECPAKNACFFYVLSKPRPKKIFWVFSLSEEKTTLSKFIKMLKKFYL